LPDVQIALGRIVATHGVAGWLRLKLYNPEGRTLYSVAEVALASSGTHLTLRVDQVKPHQQFALLKLREIDDMDAARGLVGFELSVGQDTLKPLVGSEFYYEEVVGFEVLDINGEYIGTVTRIWPRQGTSLLVVAGPKKEHLVPAVKEFIREIDIVNRTVNIDVPDGLLEL